MLNRRHTVMSLSITSLVPLTIDEVAEKALRVIEVNESQFNSSIAAHATHTKRRVQLIALSQIYISWDCIHDEKDTRKHNKTRDMRKYDIFNPRTPRGGVVSTPPPLRFFCDAPRTMRRIVLKFCTAYGASFAQLLVKNFDRVMSGHGAMRS